ncbi:hypothetical protein F5B21DRAFT_455630 [Xylaria acuta]|nr:hypothetical protein F5B21DRAFT_455630 [Xylaria acuta]
MQTTMRRRAHLRKLSCACAFCAAVSEPDGPPNVPPGEFDDGAGELECVWLCWFGLGFWFWFWYCCCPAGSEVLGFTSMSAILMMRGVQRAGHRTSRSRNIRLHSYVQTSSTAVSHRNLGVWPAGRNERLMPLCASGMGLNLASGLFARRDRENNLRRGRKRDGGFGV